jgi:hypothetical protein
VPGSLLADILSTEDPTAEGEGRERRRNYRATLFVLLRYSLPNTILYLA